MSESASNQRKRPWIEVEHGDVQRTRPDVPELPDGRYVHVEDVREALGYYGTHANGCEVWMASYTERVGHCTCGFDALLGRATSDEDRP